MVAVAIRVTMRAGDGPGVDAWAQALSDPSPALAAIGEAVREDVEQRFQTETDPWGTAWARLSPVTIALRAKAGQIGKILQRTRNLANSLHARVEGKRVVIGFAAPYARVHQYGNPNNKLFGKIPAPIPAREMLPLRGGRIDLPQSLRDEIIGTFRDALRLALERARAASARAR